MVKIIEKGEGADTLFSLWNILSLYTLLVKAVYVENKRLIEVVSVWKHPVVLALGVPALSGGTDITWELVGHEDLDLLNHSLWFNKIPGGFTHSSLRDLRAPDSTEAMICFKDRNQDNDFSQRKVGLMQENHP